MKAKNVIVDLVNFHIEEDIPDWSGLIDSLVNEGFTDSEVFNICYDVRCGGDGTQY